MSVMIFKSKNGLILISLMQLAATCKEAIGWDKFALKNTVHKVKKKQTKWLIPPCINTYVDSDGHCLNYLRMSALLFVYMMTVMCLHHSWVACVPVQ